MKVKIQQLTCQRCGHQWWPSQPNVTMCPKCKSRLFNVPKKKKKEQKSQVEMLEQEYKQRKLESDRAEFCKHAAKLKLDFLETKAQRAEIRALKDSIQEGEEQIVLPRLIEFVEQYKRIIKIWHSDLCRCRRVELNDEIYDRIRIIEKLYDYLMQKNIRTQLNPETKQLEFKTSARIRGFNFIPEDAHELNEFTRKVNYKRANAVIKEAKKKTGGFLPAPKIEENELLMIEEEFIKMRSQWY